MTRFLTYLIIIVALFAGVFVAFPDVLAPIRSSDNPPATNLNNTNNSSEEEIPVEIEVIPEYEEVNTDLSFQEFMKKGEDLFNKGFYSLAANNFAAASQKQPQNINARERLIETYLKMHDFNAAEKAGQAALKSFPNESKFKILYGNVLLQKSQINEAKNIFISLEDNVPEKSYFLGAIAAYEGDFENAKKYLAQASSIAITADTANIILDAFSEFDLYPDANPLHLKLLIAKAFNQVGLLEMSVLSAKNILKENEEYRDAWIVLGYSYLLLGKPDFAKSSLDKAYQFDPTKPETTYYLSIVEAELENYNRALDFMQRSIDNGFDPKMDALKKMGDYYINQQKYSQAAEKFEEILHSSDGDISNFVQPVRLFADYLDQPGKAVEIAKWAVQKHPNSAMAFNLLGWSQIAAEDYDSAQDSLKKAVLIDPNLAAAYLNFGKLFEAQEEYKKALENYRKAHDMDPHSSVAASAAKEYNRLVSKLAKRQ